MTDEQQPVDGLVHELEGRRKRDKSRRVVYILLALWLATFAALIGVAWNGYFNEKSKALTLAQQMSAACAQGDLSPELSPEEREAFCSNAQKVIEQNDPELQDQEIQEAEIQDPEFQQSEIQDPEIQNPEKLNAEIQNPEIQDPEIQNPENQDPEIQDEETQDPEVDDPDPNDQIEAGSCTFDGHGTITFMFQTSSGPVTFECTGTQPGPPVP